MNLKPVKCPLLLMTGLMVAVTLAEPRETAEHAIAAARENLRISEEAARRIRSELAGLRQSPQASPKRLAEYRKDLTRVEAAVAERRRELRRLQALHGLGSSAKPRASASGASGQHPQLIVTPEMTEADELRALERELTSSLSEFDEMLLQEMQKATEQSGGSPAQGSAGLQAAGRSGDGSEVTEEQVDVPQRPTSGTTSTGPTRDLPPDIPDGRDDDIVARQIREAAEKETDPVLREKLWEEYRKYKQSAG